MALFKKLFTADELNNVYAAYNINAISPKQYYHQHREERLAYQKAYRINNLEHVRSIERASKAKHKAQAKNNESNSTDSSETSE